MATPKEDPKLEENRVSFWLKSKKLGDVDVTVNTKTLHVSLKHQHLSEPLVLDLDDLQMIAKRAQDVAYGTPN